MLTDCHNLVHFHPCSCICRRPGHNGSEFLRLDRWQLLYPDNWVSVLQTKTDMAHSFHHNRVISPASARLGLGLVAGA